MIGHLWHIYPKMMSHESQDGEDNKASVHTGATVCYTDDDTVSVWIHKSLDYVCNHIFWTEILVFLYFRNKDKSSYLFYAFICTSHMGVLQSNAQTAITTHSSGSILKTQYLQVKNGLKLHISRKIKTDYLKQLLWNLLYDAMVISPPQAQPSE